MKETLTIVGASARAAAFSAQRAGFSPQAVDLFADLDLCRLCPATKVADYPQGLAKAASTLPPGPWLFSGALENYPQIVDRITQQRPLLGNPGHVLRAVRDPFAVVEAFTQADLPHPKVRVADQKPGEGKWLQKPRRSSGGGKILFVSDCTKVEMETDSSCYFQQFIEGFSGSAVYVAAQERATLLGISKQLIGVEWTGAKDFCYCGSLGPISIEQRLQDRFGEIGDCLAGRFHLSGLFGVDVILANGEVWPVEINPRYTASVEVLERALSLDAISLHVAACRQGKLPKENSPPTKPPCGKAILFARQTVNVSEEFIAWTERINADCRWPVVADIPQVDSTIQRGQPLASVLAEGSDIEDVENRLRHLSANVQQLLGC